MAAHERAVNAVQANFRSIPAGTQVRLAKQTSNLFRPRARTGVGLDVSDLDGVIGVDVQARTAEVQGMCTYERLVEVTLAHGLMPLVVPQLKTITLGGAVTGLGIESSSLRNGLPHESVLEMDILTGAGNLVTASADENSDLFDVFPNSYGSLGYALRLRIQLQPVSPYVALRHVRFHSLDQLTQAVAAIDPGARARLPHGARLHLALGHRLVLVLSRLRRTTPAGASIVAPPLPAQRRLSPHRRAGEPLRHRGTGGSPARQTGP